jgi:hypothetical protein
MPYRVMSLRILDDFGLRKLTARQSSDFLRCARRAPSAGRHDHHE